LRYLFRFFISFSFSIQSSNFNRITPFIKIPFTFSLHFIITILIHFQWSHSKFIRSSRLQFFKSKFRFGTRINFKEFFCIIFIRYFMLLFKEIFKFEIFWILTGEMIFSEIFIVNWDIRVTPYEFNFIRITSHLSEKSLSIV